MLTDKDIEELKESREDVDILGDNWKKDFSVRREKAISDNVVYLKLINYCFDNLMRIKIYSSNENFKKYLLTIKINKIREMINEYDLEVQPSKHFCLLRINDYVRDNKHHLDLLIDYFFKIFSSTEDV